MLYKYIDVLDIYVFGVLCLLAVVSCFAVAGLVWRKRKIVSASLVELEEGDVFSSGDPYFDDVVRLRKQKSVLVFAWVLIGLMLASLGVWKAFGDYEDLMVARAEVAKKIGISLDQFNQGWWHVQFNDTDFELTNKDDYPVVFKDGGEPKIWFIAPIEVKVDTSYDAFRGLEKDSDD